MTPRRYLALAYVIASILGGVGLFVFSAGWDGFVTVIIIAAIFLFAFCVTVLLGVSE